MAPRLTTRQGEKTSATVHVLKPRKAKGASGTKRKGPSTGRMKPKAHEELPKRQSARQAAEKAFTAPKPAAAAQPTAPKPQTARQMTDAELRRVLQDKLVALHTRHRGIDNRLTIAEAAAADIRGEKKEVRGAIQTLGIPLAAYDEAYKKLALKTKRTDNEAYERSRALVFEALGLPVGPQPELNLEGVPDALKPAAFWEETGYRAGVGNETSDPTRDGVPPENTQDYCQGYARAMEANARGLKKLADPAPERDLPPASIPGAELRENVSGAPGAETPLAKTGTGQPDWTHFSAEPAEWSDEQRATFDNWFASLGPEDEIDIVHVGVNLAFDAAEAAALAASAPGAAEPSEMI